MTASPRSDPPRADPWAVGLALLRAGRATAAEAHYRALLPRAAASLGVARALHLGGRHAEAAPFYRAAIAGLADPLAAQLDAANGQLALEGPAAALELLRFARPTPAVLRLRSAALLRLDRLDDVLDLTAQWLDVEPDSAAAQLDRATALLALGRFAAGWAAYEHRWRMLDGHGQTAPRWQGEDVPAGRTLLVHAEQGLGDTLQFVRYLPLLRARFARLVLLVQPPLARLLAGHADVVVTRDPPAHDMQIPLLSLPLALGTRPDSIPAAIPYLLAEPGPWWARLATLAGRKIGITWTGSAPQGGEAQNRRRSLPAERLAALAEPGVTLVSLQKGQAAPEGVVDWTDGLHDFADTAALVAGLDLVITVDTAVAHLAGAMGKPVWLLNRFDSCWRWLRGRDDSPWYPSLRQFRQPTPGDWTTPLAAIAEALKA